MNVIILASLKVIKINKFGEIMVSLQIIVKFAAQKLSMFENVFIMNHVIDFFFLF